jgi:hypothetical protein
MILVKRCGQWLEKSEYNQLPKGIRGIYALHAKKTNERFDVVYIGMAHSRRGIKSRLAAHVRSKRKGPQWTHFSLFEVWDNLSQQEIRGLEGLVHEIYAKDTHANKLGKQRRAREIRSVRCRNLKKWRTRP